MPLIAEELERGVHTAEGGRQAHQNMPPAASSVNIMSEASSATGSNSMPQELSKDGVPSTADHQQPPTARSLWDKAYDALAKRMPDLVKAYDELLAKEEQMANSAPNETPPIQLPAPHGHDTRSDRSPRQVQLDTVIQNGLQRMEDNKATIKIAGHEFVLEEQTTQASNLLRWGKDCISRSVQISPEASLVWSGICLILPLLTNPTTAAQANRDGFVYVTSRAYYYAVLEIMLHLLGLNTRIDEALVSAANDHLVDLYQALLEFQFSSVLQIHQSRLKTQVHHIVPSTDWVQILLDIQAREETVNGDLEQIIGPEERHILELLNNICENTRATMEHYLSVTMQQPPSLSQHRAIQKADQERLLAKQQNCLQLLCLTRDRNGAMYDWYKDCVESRAEGTCEWFLHHESFQRWLLQESGPLLVSADPGCGKSVLAKYLIDHGLVQQSATICYHFFKDQVQNTIRQALCALLHQLFHQKSGLIRHAMGLYDDMGAALIQSETFLWTVLRDAVRDAQAGPVIIVIDALDECDESGLSSLITNLERFFCDQQLANANFKVLMTSRPYGHVVSKFCTLQAIFPRIHIHGEDEFETINQETNSVIHHRVELLAEKHRLSDKIKSSLNSQLLSIDHRTHLWVYLVFDYFETELKTTDDGINAVIQTLPKSVNQAYEQILNRSQDDETVNTAKKALSIILAARRPLTLSEMNIAMTVNSQDRGRSIDDLDLEQDVEFKSRLRTLCGLFVNVHHDKIYFLHQTAREFLIQSSPPLPTTVSSNLQWHRSITIRHAHSVFAEICMFYLDMLNSTDTEKICEDDHHSALFQYAVDYWDDHCREAGFEKSSTMADPASSLCASSHSKWIGIISGRYRRPQSSTNVLVASHLGFTSVTDLLISRGADIESKDSQGRTALMLAAESGHEAVTLLLLYNGADVKAKDIQGRTALMHAAAESGHEAVTRLLLENGADIEAADGDGRTALMLAAESGHEAVTRLLLKNGANIKVMDDDGRTALMLAFESGHGAVTRFLLENGAAVEARDDVGRTVLILAAKSGHEAVARLLLENDTDIEAGDNGGRTALMLASKYGHETVTRLLLDYGADIEAKDDDGWTALMLASKYGHEAIARLLLDYGVNVNAQNHCGWTALISAARYGFEAVTRLLLEADANIEASDDNGTTALIYAAGSGHEAVVRILLDNSANIEANTIFGTTALVCAAGSGHEAIIRLLLENGANIEAKDDDGWTALMLASKYGHEAVIRLLLENGANVEARDYNGRTALIFAAMSDHEASMRLLLEYGADVEMKQNNGWTALMVAAMSGHEASMRLLLDNGADVNAGDEDGRTTLLYAMFSHEAVRRLLHNRA